MDDLLSTIRRVYTMSVQARAAMPATQAVTPALGPAVPEKVGKLIVVYSPKGGVGCTVVALNVATAITQISPEAKVAVVDCKLQFGDVKIGLDIRADRSIVDLAESMGELDAELIESAMVEDNRSGLKALLAPGKPEMAELVTGEHVRTILNKIRLMFDYVIVDTGSRLQDTELSVFDLADRLLLVIEPTLPAITNARYFFEIVEALEYPRDRILMILNKSDPRTGLTGRMIENSLKHPVFAEIPFEDRLVLQSVNHGIPYMIIPNVDKRSPLIQKTGVLAQSMMESFVEKEEEEDSGSQERPLGRLFH
jgi:pilus assembly protein CpaE